MNSVAIIGSGKLANLLATQLNDEYHIRCVHSRNSYTGQLLCEKHNIAFVQSIEDLPDSLDYYLLAVPDDAISDLASSLRNIISPTALVVHFSGNSSLSLLEDHFENCGVVWPVQSISDLIQDLDGAPCILEISNPTVKIGIETIANKLNGNIVYIPGSHRKILHSCAVISNNFINHLLKINFEQLKSVDLDLNLLMPIIKRTIENAQKGDPIDYQTGPAQRDDTKVIEQQKDLLTREHYKRVYEAMSASIKQDEEGK